MKTSTNMNPTFAPGRSKFLKMPTSRQHKWLAEMLGQGYQSLAEVSPVWLDRFFLDYAQCLDWMGLARPERPGTGPKGWQEWLSNRFHFHQKATGVGLGAEGYLVQPTIGDHLDDSPWAGQTNYWVALENIRSAFNLGSILRTTDALGFAGVILGSDCPPVTHNQVRKTAMGAHSWIPVVRPTDFWGHLGGLEDSGIPLIGVEKTPTSIQANRYPWPAQAVLLLGNEEFGLSDRALSRLDTLVHLPMSGRKNSLNVANAYAALGYQITSALGAN